VAAVSYELLSGRPPFTGEDPLQILEQIRTETPPPLSELDPALPPELATVVERAMQREPGDRYADLGQMGGHLELVQRALDEEAEWVRVRVRRRREDLEDVHRALAERTGTAPHGDPVPVPPSGEHKRLGALQALEQEIAARIQAARSLLARVDALAPAMEHAHQLLASGQFADAGLEFEAIVAEVPEHALAIEGLAAARARAEALRRERLSSLLIEDARSVLADGAPALCLEILAQAAEISPALLSSPEIAALRERAEAAVAAEDAAREAAACARQQAMEAREHARVAAPEHAFESWEAAETKTAEAEEVLATQGFDRARDLFTEAAALYHRAEATAEEARDRERRIAEEARLRQRHEAEQAREPAALARRAATAVHAATYAREEWHAAESVEAEANAGLSRQEYSTARALFAEARRRYAAAGQAATIAAEAEARRANALMGDARRLQSLGDVVACLRRLDQVLTLRPDHAAATALRIEVEDRLRQTENAPRNPTVPKPSDSGDRPADDRLGDTIVQTPTVVGVPPMPAEAPSELSEAEEMPSQPTATIATPGPGIAPTPSAPAIDGAGSTDTWRRPGDESESRRAGVRRIRRVAIGAGAVAAIVIAILYWRPPATPPGSPAGKHAPPSTTDAVSRDALDGARNRLAVARDEAARAGAEKLAPAQFAAALRKAQEGDLAVTQKDMATAERRYGEAIEAFGLARGEADRAGSPGRAGREARGSESRAASSTSGSSTSVSSAGRPDRMSLPPREPNTGQPVLESPGARGDVEQARLRMTAAKRGAEQVAARFFAHKRFTSAQSKERDGMAALGLSAYGAAIRLLGEAQSEYDAAAQEARQEAERDRQLAPLKASLEQAHAAVAARRQQALAADAEHLARDVFDQAQGRQVEGDGLAKRQDLAAAAQAYRDAAERYGEAILRAQAARAR
jgi:hypothetical protein